MATAEATADDLGAMAGYNEAVVRKFTVAATFWGVVGFAAGVMIALQLAFPVLNFDLEWLSSAACARCIPRR